MGTELVNSRRATTASPASALAQGRSAMPPAFGLGATGPQAQAASLKSPSTVSQPTVQRGAQILQPGTSATAPGASLVEVVATAPDASAPIPVRAGEAVDFRMGTSPVPQGVTDTLETHYFITGAAEFNSMGSAQRHLTFGGVYNGDVPVIVSGNFQSGTIEVMVEVRNVTQNRIEAVTGWQMVPQVPPAPQTIAKENGPAETAWAEPDSVYKYRLGPDLNGPAAGANYEGQTFTERFGNVYALGFDMGDLRPDWKLAHPALNTPDLVARHLFSPRSPKTFTVGPQDIVADTHPDFGAADAFQPAVLGGGKGVGYRLEQSYGLPGSVYGRSNIDHRILFGKHQVRKSDPLP